MDFRWTYFTMLRIRKGLINIFMRACTLWLNFFWKTWGFYDIIGLLKVPAFIRYLESRSDWRMHVFLTSTFPENRARSQQNRLVLRGDSPVHGRCSDTLQFLKYPLSFLEFITPSRAAFHIRNFFRHLSYIVRRMEQTRTVISLTKFFKVV